MPRPRRSIVFLCIAVVAFAGLLPAGSVDLVAILTPLWLVIAAIAIVLIRRRTLRSDEQPISLLSLVPSRAPPVNTFA
ncbi:MAG: hypothetical protein EHM89_05655 [Acidobacteria bacterium]|nr:MAG: hypothetical protein EHM89_05655 [Acidobacteriota bacterium]